jgi:putative DNA primase/helicase
MSSVNPKKVAGTSPQRMPLTAKNIPEQLRAIPNWLGWRWEWSDKSQNWNKRPKAIGGGNGSSTNSATWCDFQTAIADADNFDGLGLAMGKHGIGLVGIDIDNCRDPRTGKLSDFAQSIVDQQRTYTEISPSGTGVKLWLLCDDCDRLDSYGRQNNAVGLEVYWHGRYFTVTSELVGQAMPVAQAGEAFWELVDTHLSRKSTEPKRDYVVPIDAAETMKLAAEACEHIDCDCDYETWLNIGMALHSLDPVAGFDIWDAWSSGGSEYPGIAVLKRKWGSFQRSGVTIGTLFHHAKQAGFQMPIAIGIGFVSGRTDTANSERFINTHGEQLRFVVEWGQWIVWDGRRWSREDLGAERLAKDYAKGLWRGFSAEIERGKLTNDRDISAVQSFIRSTNSRRSIRDFLSLAQSDPRVAVSFSDLDAHPHLLNCRNGVLNFETGQFDPEPRPDLLLTQLADVDYDPRAKCPKWFETMDLVCDGDWELLAYQQEVFGHSCVGGNPNAILPIMYGDGRNGKSTIWLTMQGILGDYAMAANKELIVGNNDQHPTIFADLYRKRLVVISEPEQGSSLRESDVKRLSGSDVIRARRMRENTWQFQPTHTIWVASNHKLSVSGTDKGIWRRLKLIPYTVDLSLATTEKKDYHDWLLANESSGILNWLLEGYRVYVARDRKFAEPECVRIATQEYRAEEDTFGEWVASYCYEDSGAKSTFRDLYECYQFTGGRMGEKRFAANLKTRFDSYRSSSGDTRGQIIYLGVQPKSQAAIEFK